MKQLTSLIFLFLFTNSTFAGDLCDASCNLTITFPDGGSITAVESLTFTFGDGGLVDTVATTTAYVNGNTLMLGVGEALTFEAGSSFDLGLGGNIDYTDMAIVTTGDVVLEVVGGAGAIVIDSMSITAETISFIAPSVTVEGNLVFANDSTISGGGDITIDPAGSITLSSGVIITDPSISLVSLTAANISPVTISIGELTLLTEITIDGVLYTSDDGLVFIDSDGATGSVAFADGVFVFTPDEVLTPDEVQLSAADSGETGIALLLMIVLLVSVMRLRQDKFFSIR